MYVYLTKKAGGGSNHGGGVRNKLIPLAITDWLCFLDDNDMFRLNYINALAGELTAILDADYIVFRMSHDANDLHVLLPIHTNKPQICQVGISFAVKKSFLINNQIEFKNGSFENFYFLQSIEKANGKIIFSKKIVYNIRF